MSPGYAPPAVRIRAAAAAHAMVREVYAEAAGKATELAGAATASDVVGGVATEAELVQLLKLVVLRGALPVLREAADVGDLHPYDVYHALCALLGQFATLSEGAPAPSSPPYDHKNLGGCYDAVTRSLLVLLRADQLAANFRRIDLRRGQLPFGGLGMGTQALDPDWLQPRNAFYVCFANPDGAGRERDWYRSGHVKVASASRIANVVAQRGYGVGLVPCPKPRALPARTGALYYRLETQGTSRPEMQVEWDAVCRERSVVVHFATDGLAPGQAPPDLGMEAYVVFGR
jgi:type VI secretion system protein ImpJ